MNARAQLTQSGHWNPVCMLEDIIPGIGVCALVNHQQIAVFLLPNKELYAIGNYCPGGKANVLSRGILGSSGSEVFVASPLYKHRYSLKTGVCLDNPALTVPTYSVRTVDGVVEVFA